MIGMTTRETVAPTESVETRAAQRTQLGDADAFAAILCLLTGEVAEAPEEAPPVGDEASDLERDADEEEDEGGNPVVLFLAPPVPVAAPVPEREDGIGLAWRAKPENAVVETAFAPSNDDMRTPAVAMTPPAAPSPRRLEDANALATAQQEGVAEVLASSVTETTAAPADAPAAGSVEGPAPKLEPKNAPASATSPSSEASAGPRGPAPASAPTAAGALAAKVPPARSTLGAKAASRALGSPPHADRIETADVAGAAASVPARDVAPSVEPVPTVSPDERVRSSVETSTLTVDAVSLGVDGPSVTALRPADSGAHSPQQRSPEQAVPERPVDVDGTLRALTRHRLREESEPVAGAHAISRALRGDIDLGEGGRVHVVAKRIEAALAVRLDAELGETARVLAASAPTLASELRTPGAAPPRVTVNGPETSMSSFSSGDRSSRDGGSREGEPRGGRASAEWRLTGAVRRRVRIVL